MGSQSRAMLPELVRDSRLETILTENRTVHIYHDRPGRYAKPRREIWKRERVIGTGGNGVVWLERKRAGGPGNESRAQYRAVKQITSAHATSVLLKCKSELEALAKFSGRKYVACFAESFGWYENLDTLYIAMEYCPLGDLQRFLIKHEKLPESDTREIICQVVKGLQYMHEEGFAHRDVKPGNILIKSHPPEDEWWVKICDMGLSKRIEGVGAGTTAVKGTHGFFAPEQQGFGGVDPTSVDPYRTDIWCLGEMTFRILCDEAVFASSEDLRKYHEGVTVFPKARLQDIGASGPAISFITSAMLAQPMSRLEINQASDHAWFQMDLDNHSAAAEEYVNDPCHSESQPERDRCPDAEPLGSWSTHSSYSLPRTTEETAQRSEGDRAQHVEIIPGLVSNDVSIGHHRDEETPQNAHIRRQIPILQENGLAINTECPENNAHSPKSTVSGDNMSNGNESGSMTRPYREDCDKVRPIKTADSDAATVSSIGTRDTGRDGDVEPPDGSKTEVISESMQWLIRIESRYISLKSRAEWYFRNYQGTCEQEKIEYRWLTIEAYNNILFEADEIQLQGNEELRSRRKRLVSGVIEMIGQLEERKKKYDEEKKKQMDTKLREHDAKASQPQSQWRQPPQRVYITTEGGYIMREPSISAPSIGESSTSESNSTESSIREPSITPQSCKPCRFSYRGHTYTDRAVLILLF
ncbi:kinase-like domain-containing protein [Nemania sp. FL0916]|nr:kinase-like domain-containing protein [Nemania sp. FL0916]